MKTIIIIILLILIFLLMINQENFKQFNPVTNNTPKSFLNLDSYYGINFPSDTNTTSIYQNRFSFIPVTINDNKLVNNE